MDKAPNLRRPQTFNLNNVEMSSLQDAATLFVEKMLGVSPDSRMYKDAGYLLERSYGLNVSQQLWPQRFPEDTLH